MTGNEAVGLIMKEVKKVIIGKDDVIKQVMAAIIADGHILIDDIPGVGKTTMALAFSKAMALDYNRMQFTPDVMPSDVTGFMMLNKKTNDFEYKHGAIMCNLFLADEINRTSSKTQSSLLEAMEEGNVTVDSVTYKLPDSFNVIATQNPVGFVGTHMLPESQLDRFMFCVAVGYPDISSEAQMLKSRHTVNPLDDVNKIINSEGLCLIKNEVANIFIHDSIYEYISKIAYVSRNMKEIELGISPRGSVAITKAAKAMAYISGRNYVTSDDVNEIIIPCVRHRIILNSNIDTQNISKESVITAMVRQAVNLKIK